MCPQEHLSRFSCSQCYIHFFVSVIIPGAITCAAPLQAAADAAREAGTILFAVGVGTATSETTLLEIEGDEDNIFSVDNFDDLDGELLPWLFVLPFLDFSGGYCRR